MTDEPLTQRHVRILLVLADEPRHGYAISKEITERSGGEVALLPGSLYRALAQLERRELIREAGTDEEDPRRRSYRLTDLGRAALRTELERMERLMDEGRRLGVLPREA